MLVPQDGRGGADTHVYDEFNVIATIRLTKIHFCVVMKLFYLFQTLALKIQYSTSSNHTPFTEDQLVDHWIDLLAPDRVPLFPVHYWYPFIKGLIKIV